MAKRRYTAEEIIHKLREADVLLGQGSSIAQVCIAEALYDAEAVLSNPSAFTAEEIRTLRDQITSNLERAWEITGRSEDELTGVMMQISQVVAKQFKAED